MFSSMKLGRTEMDHARYAAVPKLEDFADLADHHLIADSANYRVRMKDPGGMLGNDRYGCCTCAAIGHLWQTVCAVTDTDCPVTEELVLSWYHEVTGWVPEDPATDNGANMLEVLLYLRSIGVIRAFARVNLQDDAKFVAGLNLAGGLYLGAGLPIAWQSGDWTAGPDTSGIWKPWSWGGHAFNQASYLRDTSGDVDTWNAWVHMTRAGKLTYCEEGYAVVFDDWFRRATRKTVQLLDLDGLQRAIARLG